MKLYFWIITSIYLKSHRIPWEIPTLCYKILIISIIKILVLGFDCFPFIASRHEGPITLFFLIKYDKINRKGNIYCSIIIF